MSGDRLERLAEQQAGVAARTAQVRAAIAGREFWAMNGGVAEYSHPDYDGLACINRSTAAPDEDHPFPTVVGPSSGTPAFTDVLAHRTADIAVKWVEYCVAEGGHAGVVSLPVDYR